MVTVRLKATFTAMAILLGTVACSSGDKPAARTTSPPFPPCNPSIFFSRTENLHLLGYRCRGEFAAASTDTDRIVGGAAHGGNVVPISIAYVARSGKWSEVKRSVGTTEVYIDADNQLDPMLFASTLDMPIRNGDIGAAGVYIMFDALDCNGKPRMANTCPVVP